jgi:hypothetical protein
MDGGVMLTVAAYLWFDEHWRHNGAFTYGPEHVRLLKSMVSKNLTVPHEFVCITDRPHLFDGDAGIRAIPLDKSTHVPGTEFVKLMTFHPMGGEMIGKRVLQLDLDTIVCGSLDEIVDRNEELVVWRNPTRVPYDKPIKAGRPYYNGSVILHTCGTMPEIWRSFDSERPPRVRDTQVWMSNMVGPHAPYWDGRDGIYRLGRADTPGSGVTGALPENARIVTFPGDMGKPWLPEVRAANPWIERYWPDALA